MIAIDRLNEAECMPPVQAPLMPHLPDPAS